MNLNELFPICDGFLEGYSGDNSTISEDGKIEVCFRDIEQRLIALISQADMVVGCVAWLTHERVLQALSKVKYGVSIVVQKEDFLRPDLGGLKSGWTKHLRSLYAALPEVEQRFNWPGLVGELSQLNDPGIDPVRCVGNYNKDRHPAFPRMHNKFLVLCRLDESGPRPEGPIIPEPKLVWTGSFNLTANATNSLENAIVIADPKIVMAYYREWEHILSISEPLDWDSEWVAPEWRIGT